LLVTPWTFALALIAGVSGRFADRFSPALLGSIGMLVLAGGLLLLAHMPTHPDAFDVAWRMALCGVGFGIFQLANNRAMMGAAPPHRSGAASGTLGAARLLGQSLGTSLVAFTLTAYGYSGTNTALYLAGGVSMLASVISHIRARV
jgi:MFS transporter, DHA2 family, multidrug resistance protein